jgi:hypothetical protein
MSAASRPRLSRDALRLVTLTEAFALSGCRVEDIYWENLLGEQLNKLLTGKKNQVIENVLDHLLAHNPNAYELLVEQAETYSESLVTRRAGQDYDAVLFTAPIVAWTRYKLPDGKLTPTQLKRLRTELAQCIFSENVELSLMNGLINFDQMPQNFHDTRLWTQRLADEALGVSTDAALPHGDSELEGLLADARFIVGVAVVPKGQAVFRWQNPLADSFPSREQCRAAWEQGVSDIIGSLFTGCQTSFLTPDAYYTNNREADRHIRPLSLKAAVTWLQTAANLSASDLRATVVGCGEALLEEYRIGFSTRQSNDVIYGCIWPILSKEEALNEQDIAEGMDSVEEIAALLKEMGVLEVRRLPGLHAAEFCDDCGAPHFPNTLGEMQHPELPEETDLEPMQFH